jgi:hypothetical protein
MSETKIIGAVTSDMRLIQLASYVRPKVIENTFKNWVLNGFKNQFYQDIIDANDGSPTLSAINRSYQSMIYGKGLSCKNPADLKKVNELISERDLRRTICDSQIFTEFSWQVIRERGNKLSGIYHLPKQLVVPAVENDEGVIENYWFCKDWTNTTKYKPEAFSAFGTSKDGLEIYVGQKYTAGQKYFGQPDYLAGLPYAEMEAEIANLNINSIRQGLSAGYIINVPDGKSLKPEEKDEFEKKIIQKLTGSSNASNFVLSFNGRDVEVTITPFPVNTSIHKQWEFLTQEARQQILTANLCTSPSIVGVISSSGFSNTADEMEEARLQLLKYVIESKQQFIINSLQEVLAFYGMEVELFFIPLTEREEVKEEKEIKDPKNNTPEVDDDRENEDKKTELSSHEIADKLISLGQDISDDYEIIDDYPCDEITLREKDLNTVFEFATVPKRGKAGSKQETSLFKIRYKYAGEGDGEREFCNKVLKANKVYREEDLNFNSDYNEELAPEGKSTYNVFLFKGGVNCKHWWQRVIYLKKDNGLISVNKARKMILALEPEDRKDARWTTNDPRVAQIASKGNNWWSLQPGYRSNGVLN